MAESPPSPPEPRESKTLTFARFVVRNRFPVALLLIGISSFFFYPILNTVMSAFDNPLPGPIVRIDTSPRDLFPDHPYLHAQDKFGKTFGGTISSQPLRLIKVGVHFDQAMDGTIRDATGGILDSFRVVRQ